jgi:hypothetical protein
MSDEQNAKAAPRRRRWLRRALVALAGLLLLTLAAPYLLSWGPCRRVVLAIVPTRIHGQIAVERAGLGWFSPPMLEQLEISPSSGEPLISAKSVELDQPLWRLASHPSDLGAVNVQDARVRLVLNDHGSNFEDVFRRPLVPRPPAQAPATKRPPPHLRQKVDLHLHNASVVWRTPAAKQDWSVDKINVTVGLRPAWAAESGSSEILIHPGKVIDHCQLSPGMCDDVLKFVAPILSKVTRAQGEISIELDNWRLPLEHPEQGELGGRLALHDVEVGPGSFVQSLAEMLHVPPNIALARESLVRFELIDGRIHHRDLEFSLPGAKIRTSGSVGFDRTLDLLAEVHVQLPEKLTSQSELARSLSGKTLRVPITGTLAKPRLEAGFVKELGLAKLFDKLEGFGVKLPGGAKSDASAASQEGDESRASDGKLLSEDAAALIEDVLRKWPERRKARRAAAEASGEPNNAEASSEGAAPSPKRRALDRLRDRLRRPANETER